MLIFIVPGLLIAYSLITGNSALGRIILTIYIIILLCVVLLALSTKDLTKFQPSVKELYQRLFKETPSSYFILGLVIFGFALGIFLILGIFLCEEWNNFCDLIFAIFCIFAFLGLILTALGLILTVKKSLKLQRQGLS